MNIILIYLLVWIFGEFPNFPFHFYNNKKANFWNDFLAFIFLRKQTLNKCFFTFSGGVVDYVGKATDMIEEISGYIYPWERLFKWSF